MSGTEPVREGELRLEVVVVPVADVDRAKDFYASLGWRLDADLAKDENYRVVQFTPPGSACSIIFGKGLTESTPGSFEGLQLTVYDIDKARADLLERGVDVRGIFHWTAVDNYEWLHGYDVSFGIIDRDRTVRPSALVLQHEAQP